MKNLYAYFLSFIVFTFSAQAQFSGNYVVANWTIGMTSASNGSVNLFSAPVSISITGSDNSAGGSTETDFTIVAPTSGIWSFDWAYNTIDGAEFDPAGVLINGVFTQLTNDGGGQSQTGTFLGSFVTAGTSIGFRVWSTDDIGGAAIFTITAFSPPGGVLPVKLSAFSAKKQESSVLLQWSSASEINASHFEVERSANGSDFEKIATVPASNASDYSSVDNAPLKGMNHYRLRMVDNNGTFSYSKILSVKTKEQSRISAYPNPVSKELTVTITADLNAHEQISIYDASGRLVKNQTIQLVQGINQVRLDVSSLRSGMYMIKSGNNPSISFIRK
jgi:hypothetical protein